MAKFTPGPWEAGRPDMATIVEGSPSKWVYAGGKYVALASGVDVEDWSEVIANAHLIAAAPDMYEALDHIYHLHSIGAFTLQDRYYGAIAKIADALRKAEGGGE